MRLLRPFFLPLLLLIVPAAYGHTKVTFDEVPLHIPNEPFPAKIGLANFQGGKVTGITNDTKWGTGACFWTSAPHAWGGGTFFYDRSMRIDFDKPVAGIEFDLANGVGPDLTISPDKKVTYLIRDDFGRFIQVDFDPFVYSNNQGKHIQHIKFPY
ncbi:MAG: hypothetical protein M3Q69_00005, partial [Acidobacteriota bacterium]|nr:hypothetical protein [Acidobacteriota bacterium]